MTNWNKFIFNKDKRCWINRNKITKNGDACRNDIQPFCMFLWYLKAQLNLNLEGKLENSKDPKWTQKKWESPFGYSMLIIFLYISYLHFHNSISNIMFSSWMIKGSLHIVIHLLSKRNFSTSILDSNYKLKQKAISVSIY
jgi:hypothetical protein